MNITIDSMEVNEAGGVTKVNWTITASSRSFSIKDVGSSEFVPDANAAGFIPYNQLKQSDVENWVMNSVDQQSIHQRLSEGAEKHSQESSGRSLPWA